MSFRRQMIVGYMTLVGLVVATGATGVVALHATTSRLEQIATQVADRSAAIQRIRYLAEEVVSASRAYVFVGDDVSHLAFDNAAKTFEDELVRIHDSPHTDRVEAAARSYVASARDAATARASQPVAHVFESRLRPQRHELEAQLAAFVEEQRAAVDHAARHTRELAGGVQAGLVAATAVAVAIGILLALNVVRRLLLLYAREREATRAAEQAAEARQQVLAIVSHDLRNPLGAIVTGTSLLADQLHGESERRQLAVIRSASERMASMIDQLLDAARIDSGTLELVRQPVDLDSILDEALLLFQARAAARGVELRLDAAPAVVLRIDRERILQVLSNLLANALKFTPTLGAIRVAAEQRGETVAVTIADTGRGIAPDALPKIFERYWHGDRGGGLGLGLYICKQIVEAHGGRIAAESELGRGTSMRIDLPVG